VKEYPSIEGSAEATDLPCLAFVKYDGSNLRFEWQPGKGWWRYGTRHRIFPLNDPQFGEAVPLFLAKYAADLERVVRDAPALRGAREVIAFCEFFGPHSFAGIHDVGHPALCGVEHNDPKDLVLFDVSVHKKGFLPADEFRRLFGHLAIAEVVYEGTLTEAFIRDVREGKYPVREGVVCKGLVGRAPHGIWRRKIKTLAYLAELKERFAVDWQWYWE
jgi:hypothetical protein